MLNIIIATNKNTEAIQSVEKYGKVHLVKYDKSAKDAKNSIIKTLTGWIFVIEPWEVLISPLVVPEKPNVYHVGILNNNVLTKEVRLWHTDFNLYFTNPIYESIYYPNSIGSDIILHSQNKANLNSINDWMAAEPLSSTPIYYKAFQALQDNNFNEFVSMANAYLFRENNNGGIPCIMMKYYLAMVQIYVLNDADSAMKNLLSCLAVNPLMAEFWCLLGDLYYKSGRYYKAKVFYENAIILGKHRLKTDLWPCELNKYKSHPEKMIESCLKFEVK